MAKGDLNFSNSNPMQGASNPMQGQGFSQSPIGPSNIEQFLQQMFSQINNTGMLPRRSTPISQLPGNYRPLNQLPQASMAPAIGPSDGLLQQLNNKRLET